MQFIDLKTQQARIQSSLQKRMNDVLSKGQYIMGPEVSELEQVLGTFIGAKHCITNANGTDALVMALMALDIKPGDEVITTPFSFFATTEAISFLGATPIFVDIDPNTYLMDASLLEEKITTKTKAIIPVSLYGQCADYDAIGKIAAEFNIPVIEDAAQSFGAMSKGRYSCNLTTISCTSFFPSKPLGCYGDGGACFTNDDKIAEKLRIIRSHGQSKRYFHTTVGMNSRLDTLQAAILLTKMEVFAEEIELRKKIGARYTELLGSKFKTQKLLPEHTSVYGQYTIEVDNRESFIAALEKAGVPTAVHYPIPLHRQPVYKDQFASESYPHSELAAARVVSLPMHPYLDESTQDKIVEVVLSTLK